MSTPTGPAPTAPTAPDDVRFAVVTVCWNDLAGLQKTVESSLRQSLAPAQIVVVDGASSDGTRDWLESADLPPQVDWSSEPDRGIYDAMNIGIARLQACDVVVFMNAGDRFASDTTLDLVARDFIARRWRWAFGASEMVDASGRSTWVHAMRRPRKTRFRLGVTSVPHQAAYIRRSLLREVGTYREDIGIVADQELLYRCWQLAEPAHLNEVLAVCDDAGISSQAKPGEFARRMADIRADHGELVGRSRAADQVITRLGVRYLHWRAQVRSRRLELVP